MDMSQDRLCYDVSVEMRASEIYMFNVPCFFMIVKTIALNKQKIYPTFLLPAFLLVQMYQNYNCH